MNKNIGSREDTGSKIGEDPLTMVFPFEPDDIVL